MLNNFYEDLELGRKAEYLALGVFRKIAPACRFTHVGNDRDCYYKGDIKAITIDGKEYFIEIKDDKCIWKTGNVLCEEEVFYKERGYFGKGNMQGESDFYCVVSRKERKIYCFDFEKMRKHYKQGRFQCIDHPQQTTYCYLCSLGQMRRWGALIDTIEY